MKAVPGSTSVVSPKIGGGNVWF